LLYNFLVAVPQKCIGTIIAGTINLGVAWWLLNTVENICQDELLPPNSPWKCPGGDRVFFDASVIWGLVGAKRIFGFFFTCPRKDRERRDSNL
jgi:hypothetical protein